MSLQQKEVEHGAIGSRSISCDRGLMSAIYLSIDLLKNIDRSRDGELRLLLEHAELARC